MSDSRDFLAASELAKLYAEKPLLAHEQQLSAAQEILGRLHDRAREDFGAVSHGPSVNMPLADYYRELEEASRAVRNAINAVASMGERKREQARTGGEQS